MTLHKPDCTLMLDARAERLADGCTCGGVDRNALSHDVELSVGASGSTLVRLRLLGTELLLTPTEAVMFALRVERAGVEAGQRNVRESERASDRDAKKKAKESRHG